MSVIVCALIELLSHLPTGWQHDNGPTNVGAMVKSYSTDKRSRKKQDGVGLVDNRPYTNKLHHFARKKKRKKNVTCDTGHVTLDM